jgi:serine/threonine-protein kinase
VEPGASDRVGQDTSVWASQSLPQRDLTGRVLGDFRIDRMLGRGGMGEVYLAFQQSLDRPVALKVLKPELVSNPTHLARFEAEAWAAAKLSHPNIVHIYTIGTIDEVRFIAMEYVQGTNLREYLSRKGMPDLALALAVMRQSGLAVGAAGELGLVHRDIKPENLLLTRKGQVKVADFGLARTAESDKLALTAHGITLGTPLYMSPEQVQGHALDHRSDLYSLGVTFYHMLAGFPPFRAETALAVALKHVKDQPVDLSVHRPDLPKDLCALVMKLLEKDPANRYQSAAEMLRDLAKIKDSLTTAGQSAAVGDVSLPEARAVTKTPLPRTEASTTLPKMAGSLAKAGLGRRGLAAIAVLSLAAGAVWGYRDRSEDLVSKNAPRAAVPPGLWIADWKSIPAHGTPDAQYRFAQTRVGDHDPVAAWLAVPGRFPQATEWSFRAYLQLVRHLFRRSDAEWLSALAIELDSAHAPDSPHQKRWQALAETARAGAYAARNDPEAVASSLRYNGNDLERMEPELAELTFEILSRAQAAAGARAPAVARRLADLRATLARPLQLDYLGAAVTAVPR